MKITDRTFHRTRYRRFEEEKRKMPRKESGLVSIAVYRKTRDRLKDFGRKGIIYDEIIPQPNILLKAANTRENTLYLMVMKCVI